MTTIYRNEFGDFMLIFICLLSHAKLLETWPCGILVENWLYLLREMMGKWTSVFHMNIFLWMGMAYSTK